MANQASTTAHPTGTPTPPQAPPTQPSTGKGKPKTEEKWMVFEVVVGTHTQDHPTKVDEQGKPVEITHTPDTGPFRSRTDLCARFNSPGSRKFRRLPDDTPVNEEGNDYRRPKQEVQLDMLPVEELVRIGKREGINFRPGTSREEIIRAIQQRIKAENDDED